jgi:hypothetical protein
METRRELNVRLTPTVPLLKLRSTLHTLFCLSAHLCSPSMRGPSTHARSKMGSVLSAHYASAPPPLDLELGTQFVRAPFSSFPPSTLPRTEYKRESRPGFEPFGSES